jgi:hypothetical protein
MPQPQILAPIEEKILMSRGSGYKIATKSGTIFPEILNLPAPKIKIKNKKKHPKQIRVF